jgi:zinc protease
MVNRFRFFISFCLILGSGANAASLWGKSSDPRAGGWAHERSNLNPDPRVVWGELSNGMRYALMPHKGITGRVSLEFLVLVGSLDEEEHERGLAHFTEHMAFNGTRHFKQEDMLAFSQKLGMTFGSDVNAHTGIDQTVYLLQYKQNDEALLREGFGFLRDIADGITFDSNEIEKERGVILSELRGRDGIQYRLSESAKKFVFEGLSLSNRSPIGLTEVINSVNRDTFLKFYQKWYRPDLMVLVAVGDFEPEVFEKLIQETFSDLKRPAEKIPNRKLGKLVRSKGLKGHIYRISDIGTVFVQATSIRKGKKSKDTIEARKKETLSYFSAALLGDRVNKAISRSAGGSADHSTISNHVVSSASITIGGGDWRHGILSLDQVLRYTEKNGFREKDIEWVRKRMLTDVRRNLSLYPTLDPAIISGDLVKSIVEDKVFIGLDRELKLRDKVLRELTPKSVHRAFSDNWDLNNLAFHLAGEVSIKGGLKTVMKEVKRYRSEQLSYSPLQERLDVAFEPVDWGEKGVIKETKRIPEFDAMLSRFENNVRLNFIHSDQEPGIVRAIVRVGDGLFELPEDRIGLREFGLNTVLGSGTSHYRAEEIQSILSVSMQGFSFDVKDHDSFSFRGGFSSYELNTFLGIVTDFLYWPIFTKAAHQSAKMSSAMARMGGASGIGGGLQMLDNYLYRDDARFAWGGPRDYGSLRVSAVENWLRKPLTRGYVEISLIGDISEEEAIDSVARTLG